MSDVKGRAFVDRCCGLQPPTVHVYEEESCVWDCMLNQTSFGNNINKFYVIQLLRSSSDTYYTFNRCARACHRSANRVARSWGRVGTNGQHKLSTFSTLATAKADFEKKVTTHAT